MASSKGSAANAPSGAQDDPEQQQRLQGDHAQRQQRRRERTRRFCGALIPSATKTTVWALSLLQAACSVYLIAMTLQELLYTSPDETPQRRCRLGASPANTSPCDYTIALGAVGLLGALALLMLLMVDYALHSVKAAAEVAASEVAGPVASLGFRIYDAFKLVRLLFMGGWVAKAILLLIISVFALWWAAGVATLALVVRPADAQKLPGGAERARAVTLAAVGLAAQVAMLWLAVLSACCKCILKIRNAATKAGRAEESKREHQVPEQAPPQVVLMPAHPLGAESA